MNSKLKLVLSLLLFSLFFNLKSNANRLPFQVLYAENAYIDEFETPLKQFSLLEKDQKIILKDGHLIVAHYKGEFFEFEGSDTLYFTEIFKELYQKDPLEFTKRQEIKNLFSTRKRYMNSGIGGIIQCNPNPNIIRFNFLKGISKITVTENLPVKLSWSVEGNIPASGHYGIIVKDIFDETLVILKSDTSFIEIKLTNYKNEAQLYLVKIQDINNIDLKSYELAIELDDESVDYTGSFLRESTTAVNALQNGFELERLGKYGEALSSYKRAIELSDRNVYNALLEKFLIRANGE